MKLIECGVGIKNLLLFFLFVSTVVGAYRIAKDYVVISYQEKKILHLQRELLNEVNGRMNDLNLPRFIDFDDYQNNKFSKEHLLNENDSIVVLKGSSCKESSI